MRRMAAHTSAIDRSGKAAIAAMKALGATMPKNQDALFRQWHMLRALPRFPQKITVQDIRRALEGEGFEITDRSIQRDLNELSETFPLYCDDREKPYGWSWQKDAPGFDLPGLTVSGALTLVMAEKHLTALMPTPMVDQLQPYFKAARRRLDSEPKPHRGRSWLDKVRCVPATQPLQPSRIDADVQRVVSEALLHERQVAIRYRKRGERLTVDYRIHPLALIQRGPMLYLYCRIFDYEDARTLAMNRILSAQMLEDRVIYPPDFSVDQKAETGVWDFGPGEKVAIELEFRPGSGDHLLETPLGKDQVIAELGGGALKVTATVANTPQLMWWLLGFGEGVEVIRPAELRDKISATAEELVLVYRKDRLGH